MVSRNALLTLLAVVVPVGVYAVTTFTESPSAAPRPAVAAKTAVPSTRPAEPRSESTRQVMGNAVPVSASKSPESTVGKTGSGIEAFTEPYRDVAVAASEMGTLSDLKLKEGDVVQKGDVIAVMDDKVLRATLDVARRSMDAKGLLASAQADLDMKQIELKKLIQLRDRNHASQQEVDRMETELKVAESRLLSVREDMEVKQLEYRRIEAQLEQRIVRAPLDGVVTDLSREPGEFVSPSDPTIARVVQLDPMLIVFSVPLAQRNEVTRDQVVMLQIGDRTETVEGTIEYVSPTSDTSNSSVRVKVRLPNSNNQFQSGEKTILLLDPQPSTTPNPTSQPSTPIAHREP